MDPPALHAKTGSTPEGYYSFSQPEAPDELQELYVVSLAFGPDASIGSPVSTVEKSARMDAAR